MIFLEARSHTIALSSKAPWGERIPIVIKVPLLFYVTSFALNEGHASCQSTEWHRYNVMCQALVFLFYEISFYNFAVNPPTNYKLGLLETGISIMRNHLSASAPRALLDTALSLESQKAEAQLHLAMCRHMIGATWHFVPRQKISYHVLRDIYGFCAMVWLFSKLTAEELRFYECSQILPTKIFSNLFVATEMSLLLWSQNAWQSLGTIFYFKGIAQSRHPPP